MEHFPSVVTANTILKTKVSRHAGRVLVWRRWEGRNSRAGITTLHSHLHEIWLWHSFIKASWLPEYNNYRLGSNTFLLTVLSENDTVRSRIWQGTFWAADRRKTWSRWGFETRSRTEKHSGSWWDYARSWTCFLCLSGFLWMVPDFTCLRLSRCVFFSGLIHWFSGESSILYGGIFLGDTAECQTSGVTMRHFYVLVENMEWQKKLLISTSSKNNRLRNQWTVAEEDLSEQIFRFEVVRWSPPPSPDKKPVPQTNKTPVAQAPKETVAEEGTQPRKLRISESTESPGGTEVFCTTKACHRVTDHTNITVDYFIASIDCKLWPDGSCQDAVNRNFSIFLSETRFLRSKMMIPRRESQ